MHALCSWQLHAYKLRNQNKTTKTSKLKNGISDEIFSFLVVVVINGNDNVR